ncbi:hypothetical protein [Ammoniphilus sp. YIM 78166]|nr:hypothetical protein [Ammoniphilus sp. YIM 78166]
MRSNADLPTGLFWGISLSIPLWISIIGWFQLISRLIPLIKGIRF